MNIRPRLEIVDSTTDAIALTNRLQFGMTIKELMDIDNLKLVLEATKATSLGQDYNSDSVLGGNYNTSKATVLDPPFSAITKGYLKYKMGNTIFFAGQKQLNLDNQRFIGSVNWRQMPQSFGVLGAKYIISDNIKVKGAVLYRRDGVIPENNKKYKRGSVILHGSYKKSKSYKFFTLNNE
mgnify:CR=1 FL=1